MLVILAGVNILNRLKAKHIECQLASCAMDKNNKAEKEDGKGLQF